MIISPPFLPIRAAGQSEESWLDEAMRPTVSRLPDTHAAEGSFPLSHNLCWHNGVHIVAPTDDGGNLPVRAIADGIVRFAHQPATANVRVDDPQNYNPFQRAGTESTPAWTDNGCVIIEHTTSIGATGTAETQVTFYSLYMHLSELGRRVTAGQTNRPVWAVGDRIWRKDVVGQPGRIYGHGGQIHFEICLNETNLEALIGRAPAWVEPGAVPTADGRVDSIFGNIYFYLPTGTPTGIGAAPHRHVRGVAAISGSTLGQPIWVQMSYSHGGCTFETFDANGRSIGALPAHGRAEYELYAEAGRRHASLSATERATSSPSGWYELLRFGRNIGHGTAADDQDPVPAEAAHWRQIVGPAGSALWADLNAPGAFKFSDADFLPAMGWSCYGDDTNPTDQRCDSAHLKESIRDPDSTNSNRMESEQLAARLGRSDVQKKLRRAICKFPSEWDRHTSSQRYGFAENLLTLISGSGESWTLLQAHLRDLTFDGLPVGYLGADWRMHPREFFLSMRRCGWLGASELSRVLHAAPADGRTRAEVVRTAMCTSTRKYGVDVSKLRVAHFLAQVGHETGWWQYREELGNERYFRTMYEIITPVEAAEDYASGLARRLGLIHAHETQAAYGARRPGAVADKAAGMWNGASNATEGGRGGDGPRFRGRGFLQITGRRNYTSYSSYRGRDFTSDPNPRALAIDNHSSCDASGFFWAREAINAVADEGATTAAISRVGGVVNRGSATRLPLHDTERHTAFNVIWGRLNDQAG